MRMDYFSKHYNLYKEEKMGALLSGVFGMALLTCSVIQISLLTKSDDLPSKSLMGLGVSLALNMILLTLLLFSGIVFGSLGWYMPILFVLLSIVSMGFTIFNFKLINDSDFLNRHCYFGLAVNMMLGMSVTMSILSLIFITYKIASNARENVRESTQRASEKYEVMQIAERNPAEFKKVAENMRKKEEQSEPEKMKEDKSRQEAPMKRLRRLRME